MRALLMNDITVSDAHTNEILCGQAPGSLVDENSSPLPPFCVLPERLRLIHVDVHQGADPVFHVLDICSMRDITPNTPPR